MIRRSLLAAFIATTFACSKSTPLSRTPPQQPGSPILSVTIAGPASVAPGASAQLTASAVHVGLSGSEDVTAQTTWTSSDKTVLQVTGGRIDGISDGQAIVTALYSGFASTKMIVFFGTNSSYWAA